MTRRTLTLAGISLGVALAAAAAWLSWRGETGRADATDPRQVAQGKRVYDEQCARCHGAKLEGQPDWRTRLPNGRLPAPPHDADGHTWHHPDALLFRITKLGMVPPMAPDGYESDMPGYESVLTDAEIWAVLAYIKSTWPPVIQARQKRLDQRANQ